MKTPLLVVDTIRRSATSTRAPELQDMTLAEIAIARDLQRAAFRGDPSRDYSGDFDPAPIYRCQAQALATDAALRQDLTDALLAAAPVLPR